MFWSERGEPYKGKGRTVLRDVYFNCYARKEVNILMIYWCGDHLGDNGEPATSIGVSTKVYAQVDVFNKNGLNCKLLLMPYVDEKKYGIKEKILRRFPFCNLHKHWQLTEELKKANYIYIRRVGEWDKYILRFLATIKKENPLSVIVWELQTYPYDKEIAEKITDLPLLMKDRYYRRYAKKYIDRVAVLTNDKEIFGIRTLHINNGIKIEDYVKRKPQMNDSDELNCIAVARLGFWHGYDRFIEGLHHYYEKGSRRKVMFHLVGDGVVLPKYIDLVRKHHLEKYVVFHGRQSGEKLDDIYDKCNLAIGSLGCYRKGMHETQELKSREYLAKGLPFIGSVKITDIPEADKDNIYLQVPNNDSPIDIEAVLSFYDRIYSEGAEQVNNRLRQFAQDHFSMEAAMKEVIDYFKEGK